MSVRMRHNFLCLVARRGSCVPSQGHECPSQAGPRRVVLTGLPGSGNGKAGSRGVVEGSGQEHRLWTHGTVL